VSAVLLLDPMPLPDGLGIPAEDWHQTPTSVQQQFLSLLKRVEALEARVNRDSSNSSRPPSTDSPATKRQRRTQAAERRKPGGKPGHAGHPQVLLAPTSSVSLFPRACACGHGEFAEVVLYHTHQVIELPVIRPEVTHWMLHQGRCLACGTLCKAALPAEHASGYGPRLTGFVGEMAGMVGASRSAVQDLCASVFSIALSQGAIQKMVDRVSEALVPHDTAIGEVARTSLVNYIDETSWLLHGDRHWLWVMANPAVAYFQVHMHRSKTAFAQLIGDWTGILVSDGYRVYQSWAGLRQSCLAHLIRAAQGLAESVEAGMARFGRRVHAELQRLCHMGTARPTVGKWRMWYARFRALVNQHAAREDKAGTFARRLAREGESLWVFLDVQGVEATNNIAERAHRFGVLWRKRSQGTRSEKGNRWVERVLSLRHTCRIRGRPTFPVLVEAVSCLFKGEKPDLSWLTQHAFLPVPSTP
jgi:transposase